MNTSSRRHGIAAAISVLFAMALAAAVAGRGCQSDLDGPTEAARAFATAAAAGDRSAMLEMLGPQTLERLESAAARATELVGGEGRYQARDMLQPLSERRSPISIVNMGRDGDRASLSLTDHRGEKSTITAVLVEKKWLIELDDEL